MCDTFVALSDATSDGSVILAKNSDREPNEAHEVVLVPAADHAVGARLATTYIEIDQAAHTHAVLLAKPFWMWGAEMGVNSRGVAIGNEAVFTKVPRETHDGLIGMDLLRLALERADSAPTAVAVIGDLLARYGQGGQCGFAHDLRYDNSFIVADPHEAWVLEIIGREWVARRVRAYASISNALTTRTRWDDCSPGLLDDARQRGFLEDGGWLDVAQAYSDWLYTRFSDSESRQCRTEGALAAAWQQVTVGRAMSVLRDHGAAGAKPGWTPATSLAGQTVCAHASLGPIRVSQSTGSMVVHLAPGRAPAVWLTATSSPCTSVFKPVWFDGGLPDLGPSPTGRYDAGTLWWQHENLHRETLRAYPARLATFQGPRDRLEARLRERADDAAAGTPEQRRALTAEAFDSAASAEQRWLEAVLRVPARSRVGAAHRLAWSRFDAAAGRPTGGAVARNREGAATVGHRVKGAHP